MEIVDKHSKYAHLCILPHPLPPLWWLNFSWTRFSNYMACQPPLYIIAIPLPSEEKNLGMFQAIGHTTPTKYHLSSPD